MANTNNFKIQEIIDMMKDIDKEFFYEDNCKKIAIICKDNPLLAIDYATNCNELDLVYFCSALEYIFELKPFKELYNVITIRCLDIKDEDNLDSIKTDLKFSNHYFSK